MDTGTLHTRLQQDGFVLIKNAFPAQVLENNALLARFWNTFSENRFFYSLLEYDDETNLALSQQITGLFSEYLKPRFPTHRFLTGSFLAKPAQAHSEFLLHQDWNYTDEEQYRSFTCWTPLVPTDESSGCLFFVKGSHRGPHRLRSQTYETNRHPLAEIGRENIVSVPMVPGDILLFDPAVWHGSFPNHANHGRLAATCLLFPQEAPFLYYYRQNASECRVYHMQDQCLEKHLKSLVKGIVPEESYSHSTVVPYVHQGLSAQELKNSIR